uniref:Uncharacterized protein n=1 Tax=Melanopsichium pennsylvanicum 4 TaxID=1398559 RepID=A0A077RA87_9BASI|nr:hypothetical protein BN887_01886 [Melanopsichium pennsylvanicum 4]
MSVATRPRSMTAHCNSSTLVTPPFSSSKQPAPKFNNFRPVRYQTKEELDRFFGTTAVQKREQRLRVRESDGQVYFDWIEKDEWQHLLATGSLTSPNSPGDAERRRSSAATFLTLNSPLRPSSPARRASLATPGTSGSMSLLVGKLGDVGLGGGVGKDVEGGMERRGRKRSNSALAGRNGKVDEQVPLRKGEEKNWMSVPGFKRRQSDGLVFSPRRSHCASRDGVEQPIIHDDSDKIRISRLPLSHRKVDQETLDQAFGMNNPLLDLSPSATLLQPRVHKPPTLHIPTQSQKGLIEVDDATSPTCSSPRSPLPSGNTFDSFSNGTRRGTFGALFPAEQQLSIPVVSSPNRRARYQSDSATTPPSSAAMEFLQSPIPTAASSQPLRTLRHALSFDTPRRASFGDNSPPIPSNPWTQRQRWRSAEDSSCNSAPPRPERNPRAVRSVASLRETSNEVSRNPRAPSMHASVTMDRARKMSGSSGDSCASEACWTPLAPRTGAKKFDRTRMQHLNSLSHPSPTSTISSLPHVEKVSPMRDPFATINSARPCIQHITAGSSKDETVKGSAKQPKSIKMRMGTGLRTGPEVYQGVDIPCASIHLHSDPEDNFEPALALTMSSSKLKKFKKKNQLATNSMSGLSAADSNSSVASVGQF